MRTLKYPKMWETEKYVTWPISHTNPFIRVPLPSGRYMIRSVPRSDDEIETFNRCVALRDKIGTQLWGDLRWNDILSVQARSVAHHIKAGKKGSDKTGVHHEDRNGGLKWVATWYERRADGSSRKRSRSFSYGGERSMFASSGQAYQAAVDRREKEERRWYCVIEDQLINERPIEGYLHE